MTTRIQWRRDTAANWTSKDPTLLAGEAGYETDTGKIKVGDGSTAWTLLSYYASGAHKDTHDPEDGSDKLDTAIPVKVGAANAVGSSHSFSRADHVHEREHAKYTDAEALIQAKANIEDTPVDGHTEQGASSNWAYDHGHDTTNIHTLLQDADGDTKIQTEEAADEDKIRMDVAGVEAFLLSTAGRLTLVKQSFFTARRTTVQSIPQTTWTKIEYNTEDVDIQGEYDPTTNFRFTAVEAGIYIVFISAGLDTPADGTRIILDAYKNGAACLRLCDTAVGAAVAFPPGGTSGIINLAANDYMEAFIYQTGAAKNIAADASANRFSAAKIA